MGVWSVTRSCKDTIVLTSVRWGKGAGTPRRAGLESAKVSPEQRSALRSQIPPSHGRMLQESGPVVRAEHCLALGFASAVWPCS